MAGGIFVSYRRDDSRHAAGRLLDRLRHTYEPHQLFMDVDNVAPGLDFVKVIEEQVAACDVMLVVIGPNWIDARDEGGARRLDNPRDFVRLEVETALKRDVRVIPVLVDAAAIPQEDALPESLRPLAKRQSVRLTHDQFGSEADSLVRSLQDVVRPLGKKSWGRLFPRTWGRSESLVLVLALAVIGIVLPFVVLEWDDRPRYTYRQGTIPIFIVSETPAPVGPHRRGVYTHQGIPGVLLGVVLPLCLLAAAALIGVSSWKSVGPKGGLPVRGGPLPPPARRGPPPLSTARRGPPPLP